MNNKRIIYGHRDHYNYCKEKIMQLKIKKMKKLIEESKQDRCSKCGVIITKENKSYLETTCSTCHIKFCKRLINEYKNKM